MRAAPASSASGVDDPSAPDLWDAVGLLVGRAAGVDDLRAHGLHLIAAARMRGRGEPVPPELADEERAAAARMLAAPLLLGRIRDACDGPIVLMKGYEVALRHPVPRLRPFRDVDLLVPDADRAHAQLVAAGFEPLGPGDDYYARRHHLRPLCLPELPMLVEVHRRPEWVRWCAAPPVDELLAAAVPSRSGIDGILAPAPAQHALLVAAHSWSGLPVRRLLDLVDALALAGGGSSPEAAEWAERWGIAGLWRFFASLEDVLFRGAPPSRLTRAIAGNATHVRDATVLEQHRKRLLGPFAVLPAQRALGQAVRRLADDLRPADDEPWSTKAARARVAVGNAFTARTRHDAELERRRLKRR